MSFKLADTQQTLIPLQPGLFRETGADGEITLLGSVCSDCAQRMFPPRKRCVKCFGASLTVQPLESLGKVESSTVIRMAPPGYHGAVPYALGIVLLGNDVHVLAHLTGKPVDDWRLGESVVSHAMVLPVGPSGVKPKLTFCFRSLVTK
jgi:uncharacterized OB-fold protein